MFLLVIVFGILDFHWHRMFLLDPVTFSQTKKYCCGVALLHIDAVRVNLLAMSDNF